jgi:hypothetical protein
LLNVDDIVFGVCSLLKNKIKPGKYNMVNKKNFKAIDLIERIQKKGKFKIKIKWLSSRVIKEKIYKYKSLPKWNARSSRMDDLAKFILRDYKT